MTEMENILDDFLKVEYEKPLQRICMSCSKQYEIDYFSHFVSYKPENGICWKCFKKSISQRDLTIEEEDYLIKQYVKEQERLENLVDVTYAEPTLPDYLNTAQKEIIKVRAKAYITAKMIDREDEKVAEAVEKVKGFCGKIGYRDIDPKLLQVLGLIVKDYEDQLKSKASKNIRIGGI